MRLVDQRRVSRLGRLDPGSRHVCASGVERDRHDLQSQRMQLLAKRLPDWQVMPAASPRSPGDEEHLRSTQRTDIEDGTVQIRQSQIRHVDTLDRTTARFWSETPKSTRLIAD